MPEPRRKPSARCGKAPEARMTASASRTRGLHGQARPGKVPILRIAARAPRRTSRAASKLQQEICRMSMRVIAGIDLACAVLALVAAGCAGDKVTRIADEAAFQKIVIDANQPVLVDFYKGGCATCIPLDGVMDQLVDEYKGRAIIAKFQTMTLLFGIPSRQLKEKYDIVFFPTAILFVNGQEKRRWIIRYGITGYRKELDQLVPPVTTRKAAAEAGQLAEKE